MTRLEKYAPPGMDMRWVRNWMIITGILCLLFDIADCIAFLWESIGQLYDPITGELLENAQMPDYGSVWDRESINMSWFSMLCFPVYVIDAYSYFRKNSKSIYTMARVRSPWELHIRCWTLPLLAAVVMVVGRMTLRMILFVIYVLATPAGVPKPGF